MTVLVGTAMALLAVAAALTLWRMVVGPTLLDRIIAADVIVAIVIAGVAGYTMLTRVPAGIPVVLILSLVGFSGAVAVARLLASEAGAQRVFRRRQNLRQEAGDD